MCIILFADDQVVLAKDQQSTIHINSKLIEEFTNWGLEININKIQYINIGSTGQNIETESGLEKMLYSTNT